MKYCWTTLMVADLETSTAFYRDIIGLPVNRRFSAGPDTEIAFLGSGDTQVELIQRKGADAMVGNAISLGFAVDSLDETFAFIAKQGIAVADGPYQPNEHIKFFYVLDPDGVRVQFSESM